jgi:NADPH:quinone reductase
MKAVLVSHHGGPDALGVVERPLPTPDTGEVLVRHDAIGVNFVDTQHRSGAPYPIGLPFAPGIEASGTVIDTGAGCDAFGPGDRVAFVGYMSGVYAEYSCVPWQRLVPVPHDVTAVQAAASLLQAMTAHALTFSAAPVAAGETVLVHSAAGGVGSYLVQLSKRRGATVIATVSTPAKAALATALGADHVFLHSATELAQRIAEVAPGGVHIGRDTFDLSLDALRATGRLVIYGLTTGAIAPFDINRLSGITGASSNGSLHLTWATVADYTADRDDLLWRAADVLGWVADGSLAIPNTQLLSLDDAPRAHRLIEQRTHIGKIVLLPFMDDGSSSAGAWPELNRECERAAPVVTGRGG